MCAINRCAPFLLLLAFAPSIAAAQQLTVVSVRDHVEGSFTVSRSLYADDKMIFAVSAQNEMFVLRNQQHRDYPLLDRFPVSGNGSATAVRGDRRNLYVSAQDGKLRVYENRNGVPLARTVTLRDDLLSSLVLSETAIYVGTGQVAMAANSGRIFLSQLNPNDAVLEVDRTSDEVARSFGESSFEPGQTVVFDWGTGRRLASIPNPTDVFGRTNQFVSLYADEDYLIQTTPGCCGRGIYIYDGATLAFSQLVPLLWANTVARHGRWLVAGTEAGGVAVFDLDQSPAALVASVDLRTVTGHTGSEDIEIRTLAIVPEKGRRGQDEFTIFAGSSWGNDLSRGPLLPSIFVLRFAS